MRKIFALLLILALTPAIAAAKDPEIIELSPNRYMITRDSKAGMFANMEKLKNKVIRQAKDFAEDQGKTMVIVSQQVSRPTHGFPTFELVFLLADEDDLDEAGNLIDAEDPEEVDVYSELIKLDDLRNRGILTDQEFEEQKRKLLESGNE